MYQSLVEFFCLHRKNLMLHLVMRNFKVKYRGSIFGYFWTLLIPFSQVVIFYFVYKIVLRIEVPNYLAFVVTGIMPWVFFSSTINESFDTLVAGQGLLTHIPMPIQAFSAAAVVSNFLSFLISVPVILGVLVYSGIEFQPRMLLFFPLSLFLFLFTYSLSFILACIFVTFRDLKYLFGLFVQVWMYLTPVVYPRSMLPKEFEWTLWANPLSGYFVNIHAVLVEARPIEWDLIWAFGIWSLVLMFIANVMRGQVAPYLVEKL